MEQKQSQQLPQIVIEYIDEVIKRMGYRRKVRQDVRQELTDHFTDALDHLSTEEAKLAAAKELIEQFGDAAMLGKLMRRAKKRCRPWWIKFIIRSLQIFGAFILVVVLYSVWLLSGKPIISTDYIAEYNELIKPAANISDYQNAFVLFTKAAEQYIDFSEIEIKGNSDEPKSTFNPGYNRYSALDERDEKLVRIWIVENEPAYLLWTEGSRKPYFWQNYTSDTKAFIEILLPNMGEWRGISMMLMWRAYLEAKDGDFKACFDDILTSYRAGKHIKDQTILIEQLVGMSILSFTDQTLCRIVNDFDVPKTELEFLSDELVKLHHEMDFTVHFDSEKYLILDEIQRCYVTTPIGDHLYLKRVEREAKLFSVPELGSLFGFIKVAFTHPDKNKAIAEVNAFYETVKKYSADMPYEIDDLEGLLKKQTGNNFMLNLLTDSFGKCILTGYRTKSNAEATILVLAAHIYKADNGNFPESLERLLCDDYIKEIPIDPFSGKPLVYRKTDESFLLYSVGLDETDNDGKIEYDGEGEKILWSKKDGYDAIFWPVE